MILLRSIHACPPAKTSQEPLFGVSTNGNVAYAAQRQVCSADYGHLMGAFRQEPQRVVALILAKRARSRLTVRPSNAARAIRGGAPEGDRLRRRAASADATARIWRVYGKRQELVDAAKARLPRCLTSEERRQAFLDDTAPPRWCITGAGLEREREASNWEPKWPRDSLVWKDWLVGTRKWNAAARRRRPDLAGAALQGRADKGGRENISETMYQLLGEPYVLADRLLHADKMCLRSKLQADDRQSARLIAVPELRAAV
jgi:hypothetical protein